MKMPSLAFLLVFSAGVAGAMPEARKVPSPDGQFTLALGPSVDVLDAQGQAVLTVDAFPTAVLQYQASWSADSHRVVVVENTRRGSVVLAGWRNGNAWHRGLELTPNPDLEGLVADNGPLTEEHRAIGNWVSPDAIDLHGVYRFKNGAGAAYDYTLQFVTPRDARLDRGGYEENAAIGTEYRLEAP